YPYQGCALTGLSYERETRRGKWILPASVTASNLPSPPITRRYSVPQDAGSTLSPCHQVLRRAVSADPHTDSASAADEMSTTARARADRVSPVECDQCGYDYAALRRDQLTTALSSEVDALIDELA